MCEDFESFCPNPITFLVIKRKLGLPAIDEYFKDADYQFEKIKFNNTITEMLEERPETFRFIFDNMVLSLKEKLRITCTSLKSHHLKLPKSGYIVIVIKDNIFRSSWKLGNIQYLRTGLHEDINELTFSFLII